MAVFKNPIKFSNYLSYKFLLKNLKNDSKSFLDTSRRDRYFASSLENKSFFNTYYYALLPLRRNINMSIID